jgi:DDE superfamily endonuclease
VLSYRVMLDVPLQLASFLAELLADHRREIGTRHGTRALTCWKQAVFALAWFRDRPDIPRLGTGFGISQATAYRYLDEAIEVLAARAPGLREALEKAREQGLPYLILDGKVVAADRCKEKTISRKGREIDRWYSGKAHGFGGNIQALFTPGGIPLWVSGVLPGGVHDITAVRELVLAILRPFLKDLPVLADSGYEGAGCGVHVPVKNPAGGRELDLDTRTRNALLRSLRCLGERGFALMSQRWRTLQRVMLSPGKIGDIAQAALVLVQFEHKMITSESLRQASGRFA